MEQLDLIIIGGGPAGLAAAAHAQTNGIRYALLERSDHLADTVHNYQARKAVMSEPAQIPIRGDLPFAAGSRESILAAWNQYASDHNLNVIYRAEVTTVTREEKGFVITTADSRQYSAQKLIIAMGTQGNPRKLGVAGEDRPHVFYRLADPAEHQDRDILVVGAGDAGMEIAIALSDENRVALVVRGTEITRVNDTLLKEVLSRAAQNQLRIHYDTSVREVGEGWADLNVRGEAMRVKADLLFLKLGAEPPRKFLERAGVQFSGDGGDARPILNANHETSVPGLFLIGAAGGRDLIKLGINQAYEVIEFLMGREVEPADESILREKLRFWSGSVRERIATIREKTPLLAAASEAQVRDMMLSVTVREYADDEIVFQQNDYTNDFMIIAAGRVELLRVADRTGEETVIGELTAGNFFGELSLISGRRRSATVRARGSARLIIIPRKAILKFLTVAPAARALVDQAFLLRAFRGFVFQNVPEGELGELVNLATVEHFGKDAVVFREGDPADKFYLIRNGMVKISKVSGDNEVVLSYLVAGNFFGEAALYTNNARSATVTTIFPSQLISISSSTFERFLAAKPELRRLFKNKLEQNRVASLVADATPRSGHILGELIREEVVMGTQTLLIDEHLCIRCGNCVSACEGVHDDGQARLSLTGIKFYNLLAPNSCWHCENPLCMLDCPPDAIARDARGEVYIKSNCIGCGNCERNCPYDNIFMVHKEPKKSIFGWITSLFGKTREETIDQSVAVKCDLCRDIKGGPACVRHCPTGAAIRLTPDEYRTVVEEMVVSRGAT